MSVRIRPVVLLKRLEGLNSSSTVSLRSDTKPIEEVSSPQTFKLRGAASGHTTAELHDNLPLGVWFDTLDSAA